METRFINDHDVAYYRALVADKFGDCEDDDWWHAFDRYDINVTLTDSGDAWKATLYLCNEQMNDTLTDRWQSLGVIKYKQKGKSMETINETSSEQMNLHQALLRINALEKTNEVLRSRIDRDIDRFDEFVKHVDAFLKGVVEEYDLEATDSLYTENLKQWVDRDVLTDHFVEEHTYEVCCTSDKRFIVTVSHAKGMPASDVEDMLQQAFYDAEGDEHQVDDELSSGVEITDVSVLQDSFDVDASRIKN